MGNFSIESIWPELKVEDLIGSGASGDVYHVYRESFGKKYYSAVKVIPILRDKSDVDSFRNDGMDDASIAAYYKEVVEQLDGEIDLMESMKSVPNIVTIEDFEIRQQEDNPGWVAYIRMELLENLNTYRSRHGMNAADVVKLGIDICSALEYYARRNIIHRDIKQKNHNMHIFRT